LGVAQRTWGGGERQSADAGKRGGIRGLACARPPSGKNGKKGSGVSKQKSKKKSGSPRPKQNGSITGKENPECVFLRSRKVVSTTPQSL